MGGMVMGAMSDAPVGKKAYVDLLAKAPLSKNEREEARGLERTQQVKLAQALAAGYRSDVAFLVAYTVGPDPISREDAYKSIVEL